MGEINKTEQQLKIDTKNEENVFPSGFSKNTEKKLWKEIWKKEKNTELLGEPSPENKDNEGSYEGLKILAAIKDFWASFIAKDFSKVQQLSRSLTTDLFKLRDDMLKMCSTDFLKDSSTSRNKGFKSHDELENLICEPAFWNFYGDKMISLYEDIKREQEKKIKEQSDN